MRRAAGVPTGHLHERHWRFKKGLGWLFESREFDLRWRQVTDETFKTVVVKGYHYSLPSCRFGFESRRLYLLLAFVPFFLRGHGTRGGGEKHPRARKGAQGWSPGVGPEEV